MSADDVAVATKDDFARLTDPFRRELLAHCYRMLGSVHDAEDLVQETYLRAWRSFDGFEGRASLRTWLYRIATRSCLTALDRRGRRPLPSGLGGPSDGPDEPLPARLDDVPWLTPFPDAALGDDPASIVALRSSVRLALVAALQELSPRQRAVFLLREVLAWPAVDTAQVLDISPAAVNSALQRARAQLAEVTTSEETLTDPTDPILRRLLDRYVEAFQNADVSALVDVLREDVVLEMPPVPAWFAGRHSVTRFFEARVLREPGRYRLAPTAANGQPAFGTYMRDSEGTHRPHGVHVLTIIEGGISRIDSFLDAELFPLFGLPDAYPSADG